MNVFSTIIASLTTIPFITFFILLVVFKKLTKRSTQSTKLAADLSVIFFVIGINGLTNLLFDRFYIWEMVVGLLILLGFSLFLQWKNDQEISFWRAFRVVWRYSFVIAVIGYTGLLCTAFVLSL